MSARRLIGMETEYGIHAPQIPEQAMSASPSSWSTPMLPTSQKRVEQSLEQSGTISRNLLG